MPIRCKACGGILYHKKCCDEADTHEYEPVLEQSPLLIAPAQTGYKCRICDKETGRATPAGKQLDYLESLPETVRNKIIENNDKWHTKCEGQENENYEINAIKDRLERQGYKYCGMFQTTASDMSHCFIKGKKLIKIIIVDEADEGTLKWVSKFTDGL